MSEKILVKECWVNRWMLDTGNQILDMLDKLDRLDRQYSSKTSKTI